VELKSGLRCDCERTVMILVYLYSFAPHLFTRKCKCFSSEKLRHKTAAAMKNDVLISSSFVGNRTTVASPSQNNTE